MVYSYGITQQGAYHIKNNIVCQDAHNIRKCGENMIIAAVADGLGSEEHSDIASKIAVDVSVQYCNDNVTEKSSEEEIKTIISDAFQLSQETIEKKADENGHSYDQYDTTLTLAILIGKDLYYGHSGDSGMIALTSDGLYHKITEQQRDDEGRVLPLFFGDKTWVIEKCPYDVVSVLLATDGIFEIFFPIYIRKEPVNLYVALARFFMDPNVIRIEEIGEESVSIKMEQFLKNIPERQVNDDKTLVVITNTSTQLSYQPNEYYQEPNWVELKKKYDEEWRRTAYPHLYQDEPDQIEEDTSDSTDIVLGSEDEVEEATEDVLLTEDNTTEDKSLTNSEESVSSDSDSTDEDEMLLIDEND